jgi:hypothetical protein
VTEHEIEKDKKKDRSRSAYLFDLVCNLVRCNVPDDLIFGIITDPTWGVSESVLELKGNAERYALKQIASAKEFAIDPHLAAMNKRFTVVGDYGGRCLIVEEVMSDNAHFKRKILKKQSFEEFKKRFMRELIKVGVDDKGNDRKVPLGKWWLEHPNRAQVDRVVFRPDQLEVPDCFNLWKGFAVQAVPGDKHLPYLTHMKNIICDGNEEHYEYLLKWMARAVQYPAEPGQVAIVLQGGRGTGKGFFVTQFGSLFGGHFMQVSNSSHIVGNFNAHLRDALILFSDEAFYANDKKHNSTLKTLITEDILPIEGKGLDLEFGQNYVHLIMSSNEEHVLRTGVDERRFFILRVNEDMKQNTDYFEAVTEAMNSGGRENLLYYLMSYDVEKFQVRNVPKTKALQAQTDFSLDSRDEWLFRCLQRGSWSEDKEEWEEVIPRRQLYEIYVKDVTFGTRHSAIPSETAFNNWLKARLPDASHGQYTVNMEFPTHEGFSREVKKRLRCWKLPKLTRSRNLWEKYRGMEETWD